MRAGHQGAGMPEQEELYSQYGRVSSRFGGRVGEGLKLNREEPTQDQQREVPRDNHTLELYVEHCTAPRPTASLKGSTEAYTDLADALEATLKQRFSEWQLDFVENPSPEMAPYDFVKPSEAYSYHGRVGSPQQNYFVEDLCLMDRRALQNGERVLDKSTYPATIHSYPRLGLLRCATELPRMRMGRCSMSKRSTQSWRSRSFQS